VVGAAVLGWVGTSAPARGEAQHTLGPSWQLMVIDTKQGNTSSVQGPGVSYAATLGGNWGFQGTFTAYFPLTAYQNGKHITVSDVYSSAWGIDAVLAASRRLCFSSSLQLDVALGPHLDGLVMKGQRTSTNNGYTDFNSFTMGVGVSAVLRWRLGSGPLILGAFGSGAVDFLDLLHGGDLSVGYGITAGALVGVTLQ
jgi:hypothetical protein